MSDCGNSISPGRPALPSQQQQPVPPIAVPGSELDTPAVVIDYAQVVQNVRHHAERCRRVGVLTRPHVKTHKCVEIARLQRDLGGAVGITVSKVRLCVCVCMGVGVVLVVYEFVCICLLLSLHVIIMAIAGGGCL